MAELPKLSRTQPHIERRIHKALVERREKVAAEKAGRLALSQVGDCPRNLWAGVNGIPEDAPINPRMLVLFEHGNAAENHMIGLLRRAGFDVIDRGPDGEQLRVVDAEGRTSGRLDGLIRDGRRTTPEPWMLFEGKSANANQFERLLEVGSYEDWNPKYAAQLHSYMGYASRQLSFGPIHTALVVVECKNDSRLYAEKVGFDPGRFETLRKTVYAVLESAVALERPRAATSQYCGFCKYCPRNGWCWSSVADVRFDS